MIEDLVRCRKFARPDELRMGAPGTRLPLKSTPRVIGMAGFLRVDPHAEMMGTTPANDRWLAPIRIDGSSRSR
jgi:hypothetical protein